MEKEMTKMCEDLETFREQVTKVAETQEELLERIDYQDPQLFQNWINKRKLFEIQFKITADSRLRDDWRELEDAVRFSAFYSVETIYEICDYFKGKWLINQKRSTHFCQFGHTSTVILDILE